MKVGVRVEGIGAGSANSRLAALKERVVAEAAQTLSRPTPASPSSRRSSRAFEVGHAECQVRVCRKAVFSALNASTPLTDLLGGAVFDDMPPQ